MKLKVVLELLLDVLEVLLEVLDLSERPWRWFWVSIWDNYKDYTYVGTLDGLYQHTLIATGTRLRPVEATFLGHILGTKPAKHMMALGLLRRFHSHLGPPNRKSAKFQPSGGSNSLGTTFLYTSRTSRIRFSWSRSSNMEFKGQKPKKQIILGLLKFVKNSPTLSLWGV